LSRSSGRSWKAKSGTCCRWSDRVEKPAWQKRFRVSSIMPILGLSLQWHCAVASAARMDSESPALSIPPHSEKIAGKFTLRQLAPFAARGSTSTGVNSGAGYIETKLPKMKTKCELKGPKRSKAPGRSETGVADGIYASRPPPLLRSKRNRSPATEPEPSALQCKVWLQGNRPVCKVIEQSARNRPSKPGSQAIDQPCANPLPDQSLATS